MSAFVVSKTHVDLLVKAAIHYGCSRHQGAKMQWWQVDENGNYAGWRTLNTLGNGETEDEATPSQLGQMLVSENVRSVSYRYSSPGRTYYYGTEAASTMEDLDSDVGELPGPTDAYYMAPYVYEDPRYVLTPAEVFKAIDCLDYQSCEHDGWRSSEAFAFLTNLREIVCAEVSGYSDAPWEFDTIPARA